LADQICECKNESGRCRHHKPEGCGGAFRLHARKDDKHLHVCIPCGGALAAADWRLRTDPNKNGFGAPR